MAELPETYVPGFHDEEAVRKMKYFKFGDTGMNVSQLSIGTGGFCLQYGDYTVEECKATLHEAIKKGVNYIDTAPFYGYGVSEEVLGKCLEGIPRKAYYLATKVGRYEKDPKLMFDFSTKKTRESIQISLERLGVDYIDVLQVHDVEYAPSTKIVLEEALPVVQEAVKQGKAKFIGVTGYPVSVLADIIKQSTIKIDMVLCYTRLSILNHTLNEYLPFFESKKLGIVNAAPLCLGFLSSAGPRDWNPASKEIQDACAEAREYCKGKGIEVGRLALYYAINQPGPHTNLVGMNRRDLLNDSLDVVFNGISKIELEALEQVKKILSKLKATDWGLTDVDRYWKLVKE